MANPGSTGTATLGRRQPGRQQHRIDPDLLGHPRRVRRGHVEPQRRIGLGLGHPRRPGHPGGQQHPELGWTSRHRGRLARLCCAVRPQRAFLEQYLGCLTTSRRKCWPVRAPRRERVRLCSDLSLYLDTSYTPTCGTSVTALIAGSASGSWSSVEGTSLPSSGTWEPTTTATTAGAYVYCPPPPEVQSQTYGDGSSIDAVNASGYFAEPVNTGTGAYTSTETDATLGRPRRCVHLHTVVHLLRYCIRSPRIAGWTDSDERHGNRLGIRDRIHSHH